jgi:hypothetical protein
MKSKLSAVEQCKEAPASTYFQTSDLGIPGTTKVPKGVVGWYPYPQNIGWVVTQHIHGIRVKTGYRLI